MIDRSPQARTQENAPAVAERGVNLDGLKATARLAQHLAPHLRAGDVVGLAGPLGIGKTEFARALIRALLGPTGQREEVPSPTFTLVQTYDMPASAPGATLLYHFDLYRLTRPEDAYELAIEEAFADGISLIEWPERLGPLLPQDRLMLALSPSTRPNARRARLTGHGAWAARLKELDL
jgi:tRNA threonylcarbamoyladenosine biosynthesis protein TsaE